jgi:hypothetical protein
MLSHSNVSSVRRNLEMFRNPKVFCARRGQGRAGEVRRGQQKLGEVRRIQERAGEGCAICGDTQQTPQYFSSDVGISDPNNISRRTFS